MSPSLAGSSALRGVALFAFVACGVPHATDSSQVAGERQQASQEAAASAGCDSVQLTENRSTGAAPYTNAGCSTNAYCDWRVAESYGSGCGQATVVVCDDHCANQNGGQCSTSCSPEVVAGLQVDGAPFLPRSCQSGSDENESFFGVDLDDGTTTLRLVQAPDLTQSVIVIEDGADAAAAQTLSGCARFQLSRAPLATGPSFDASSSVFGSATLDCSGGTHSVSGTVSFGCAYAELLASEAKTCDEYAASGSQ